MTAWYMLKHTDLSVSRRAAAEVWEAAFVELARGELAGMAAPAGLGLSFSAERSVQDELARESYADLGTVRAQCSGFGPYSQGSRLHKAGCKSIADLGTVRCLWGLDPTHREAGSAKLARKRIAELGIVLDGLEALHARRAARRASWCARIYAHLGRCWGSAAARPYHAARALCYGGMCCM